MQLTYTREEILAEHDYARPHVAAGHRLHGGFDSDGNYLSPRSRLRPEAVRNWSEALRERGGCDLEVGLGLLSGPRYPNFAQVKLLLQKGLGQTLWNSLTTVGLVEARGRYLAQITAPDFQSCIEDDLSTFALGHLNRGLFEAHGLDEGGKSEEGIGGHDVMWFAVRDLAFGKDRYPIPEPPQRIGQAGNARLMPDLPAAHDQLLRFLMNLRERIIV